MARGATVFCALCVFIARLSQLCSATSIQQYESVQSADGWLRLHTTPATWLEARLRCEVEGGILASPTTDALTTAMKAKMAANSLQHSSVFTGMHANFSRGDFRSVYGVILAAPATDKLSAVVTSIITWSSLYLDRLFTGIHAIFFKKDFKSIDGVPLSNVPAPWARGEPNSLGNDEDCLAMSGAGELADVSCASELPYFCFKSNSIMADSVCGTNNGYSLEPRTGSCYKFHRTGKSWYYAAKKCDSQRAHLAVINNEEESRVLKDMFAQNPDGKITADYTNIAHIGILYANESGQWLTVFDETLNEAGFNRWDDGEPNNFYNNERCGSVSRHGTFNDSPCLTLHLPYICEITPKNHNN